MNDIDIGNIQNCPRQGVNTTLESCVCVCVCVCVCFKLTDDGETVTEATYRLNVQRQSREQEKDDWKTRKLEARRREEERLRYLETKRKLENMAKTELVRQVKVQCIQVPDNVNI